MLSKLALDLHPRSDSTELAEAVPIGLSMSIQQQCRVSCSINARNWNIVSADERKEHKKVLQTRTSSLL